MQQDILNLSASTDRLMF